MKINCCLVALVCLGIVCTKPLDDDNQAQEGDDKRDTIRKLPDDTKANSTVGSEEVAGSNNVDIAADAGESSPDQKSNIGYSATETTLLSSPASSTAAPPTEAASTIPPITTLPTNIPKGSTVAGTVAHVTVPATTTFSQIVDLENEDGKITNLISSRDHPITAKYVKNEDTPFTTTRSMSTNRVTSTSHVSTISTRKSTTIRLTTPKKTTHSSTKAYRTTPTTRQSTSTHSSKKTTEKKVVTTIKVTVPPATTKAHTTKAHTTKMQTSTPTTRPIVATTHLVVTTPKTTPSTPQTVENSKNNTYTMTATTFHVAVRLLGEKYVEDFSFVTSPVYQSLKKHFMQTVAAVYSNYPEFKQIVVIKFSNSKGSAITAALTSDLNDDKRDTVSQPEGVICDFYLRFYSSGRHLVPLTKQVVNGKIGTVPVSSQFVRAYSAEPKGRVCTPDCRIQCYSYCDSGCCHINVVQHLEPPTQSPVDALIQQQHDELRNTQQLLCQGQSCDTQLLQQPCQGQSCANSLQQPCQGPACTSPIASQQPCQGQSCAPIMPMQQPCQGQSCMPLMSMPQPCQGQTCQPSSVQQQPCQGQFCGQSMPMQQPCQGQSCGQVFQNPCIGAQCSNPIPPCQGPTCSQSPQFQIPPQLVSQQFFGLPQMNPSSCPPLCSQTCGPMCPAQCCSNRQQQMPIFPQLRCGPQGC